jgi:hypothetical protein
VNIDERVKECFEIGEQIKRLRKQLVERLKTIHLTATRPDYINGDSSVVDDEGGELYLAFVDGHLTTWRSLGKVTEGYELDFNILGVDELLELVSDLSEFIEKVKTDGATVVVSE